ncbi:sensor histidine kinase [Catenovulum maritimum]|uniref:sensor histidine kinase n=1 Tax=Catenovulum maritimum TaxID=1513271 RepID=UPI00155A5175|nr:ATP-binding protein [Catenovulum maritimum]
MSFRRQLLIIIIVSIVPLCAFGSFVSAYLASQKLESYIINDARLTTTELTEQIKLQLEQNTIELEHIWKSLKSPDLVGAAIYDKNYNLLAEKLYTQFKIKQLVSIADNDYLESLNYLYFKQQVKDQDGNPFYVVSQISKTNINSAQQTIFISIFVISTITIILLVIVINWAISKFTQPISGLASVMYESEKSGLHIQCSPEGPKEIRRMAQAYNAMMRALDDQDEELRLHRDQLEVEVLQRTKELLAARDAALTASRHKSVFLANVTHELRTPIQAIIGYIDLIREEMELEGHDNFVSDLEKVQRNSDRLLALINSILELSKVEAGKMEIDLKPLDLKQSINTAIDVVTPMLDKNQNLLVGPQNTLELFVESDKAKLEQILINLLSNACKFTQNGTISIDYRLTDFNFEVDVKDTGGGIDKDKLESIFDEFRQVSHSNKHELNANSKAYEGSGLGLAICQKFAALLGGRIKVTSKVGEGSCFTLELPLEITR